MSHRSPVRCFLFLLHRTSLHSRKYSCLCLSCSYPATNILQKNIHYDQLKATSQSLNNILLLSNTVMSSVFLFFLMCTWQQGLDFLYLSLSRIYYWYDERGKKTKCTAPQYVDFVMSLCQKLVTDEEIFPTKYGEHLLCLQACGGPEMLHAAAPCCLSWWNTGIRKISGGPKRNDRNDY